jgi:hypothetical protein
MERKGKSVDGQDKSQERQQEQSSRAKNEERTLTIKKLFILMSPKFNRRKYPFLLPSGGG